MKNFTTGTGGTPPPPAQPPTTPGGSTPQPPIPTTPPKQGNDNAVMDMLINYNEKFRTADPIKFRETLVQQNISVLIGKNKPNPLNIGPAGVGKTKIIEDIARRLVTKDDTIPPQLDGATIYELPLSNIIAGSGIHGEIEARLNAMLEFLQDPDNNAILFVDEIHNLQSGDSQYRKVGEILKPAMARGDIRVIGATTMDEAKDIDKDHALARRFTKLIVDELTVDQTIDVLHDVRAHLQSHYNNFIVVDDDTLNTVVTIADENSRIENKRPDNAITLLDRAMADTMVEHHAKIKEARTAGDQDIVDMLENIPFRKLSEHRITTVAQRIMSGVATREPYNEHSTRSALDHIIGQDTVLNDVLGLIDRDQLSLFPRTKPLSFMFAGPSGVGKTETAKVLAQQLTQQEPIILNMSEYSNESDINKITGAAAGYVGYTDGNSLPFNELRSNPHRLVILDEAEKAHLSVQRLLLSALDDGWLRMSDNTVIDFSKAIIVATTNAGWERMMGSSVGFSSSVAQSETLSDQEVTNALSEDFEQAFLGRFTKRVAFNCIKQTTYREILADMYQRQRERIAAQHPKHAVHLPDVLDDAVLDHAVRSTYQPTLGARPAEQKIREIIEDLVITGRRNASMVSIHNTLAAQQASSSDTDQA